MFVGWCIEFMEMRGMRKIEINADFWNTVIIYENDSKCHGEFLFPN